MYKHYNTKVSICLINVDNTALRKESTIMKKALFAAAAAAAVLTCGCGAKEISVNDMSIEEKAAQMLMVRCEPDMTEILDAGAGGIVMFARDFEGLTKEEVQVKTAQFQEASEIPVFIATDEEGGTVVRVSSNPYLRQEPFNSPAYYYRAGGMDNLINITAEKSQLLYELGVNMNLGPVADVSTDPDDFIYKRSLGEDETVTAQYVAEAVKAAKRHNMASCLKHFPGYGSNTDTHTGIAVDERPFEEFTKKDFLPFEAGIAEGAEAVLVSHNIVTCMDRELPASLSPAVHSVLRTNLQYNGLIITDDMEMQAVQDYGDIYIKAVNAGNDMIIVSDFDAALGEIIEGVSTGQISEETVNTAVERILKIKKECGIIEAK